MLVTGTVDVRQQVSAEAAAPEAAKAGQALLTSFDPQIDKVPIKVARTIAPRKSQVLVFFQHCRQAGFVAGLVLALLPALAQAQDTGSITGTVTDPFGGVIVETTVDLRHDASRGDQRTVTDQKGAYAFQDLRPGRYTIRVTLAGFKPYRVRVDVRPGQATRLDIVLPIGPMIQGVQVDDAEPPLIQTSEAGLGLVIPNRDLIELPLNGRNFTQLGTLMPGVLAPPAALGGQAGDATPGGFGNATGGFNVNGMRNQSNNFLLDGAPNNDSFNTGFVLRPPPDAIDEFRIFTHAFGAEYGRNAGAVVSVVTRSGSNALARVRLVVRPRRRPRGAQPLRGDQAGPGPAPVRRHGRRDRC